MVLATAVHTTGVNWESVTAIVTCVVMLMTVVFTLLARYVSGAIVTAIDRLKDEVLTKMDRRITILEVVSGLRKGLKEDASDDV
jgi:hypothetical protein